MSDFFEKDPAAHGSRDVDSASTIGQEDSITNVPLPDCDETVKGLGSIDSPEYRQIGRYRVLGTVSTRKNSTIFKAVDPDLQRMVSLKVYHDSNSSREVDRIVAEGRALSRVESRYVARCHHLETIQGTTFLVNEWIEGQSLQEYMVDHQLDYKQVVSLFRKIVEGVGQIHENGLLHRDLKPSNVVIDEKGNPKVIDLGLAQERSEEASEFAGTAVYVAPEVINECAEDIGIPTDIFGLGGILYFLLTGRALYEARSRAGLLKLASQCQIEPSHLVAGAPVNQLDRICARCLAPDPGERFQTTEQLASLLGPVNRKLIAIATIAILVTILVLGYTFRSSFAFDREAGSDPVVAVAPDSNAEAMGIVVHPPRDQAIIDRNYEVALLLTQEELDGLGQIDSGNIEKATETLELMARICFQIPDIPRAVEFREQLVEVHTQIGSHDSIIRDMNTSLDLTTGLLELDPEALGRFAQAMRLYEKGRAGFGRDFNQTQIAKSKFNAAMSLLGETVGENDQTSLECLNWIANCAYYLDQFDEIPAYFNALEAGWISTYGSDTSRLVPLYQKRAEYRKTVQGNVVGAVSDLRNATRISTELTGLNSPKTRNMQFHLSTALVSLNEYQSALDLLDQLVEYFRQNLPEGVELPSVLLNRGRTHLGLGNTGMARSDLESSIELSKALFKTNVRARIRYFDGLTTLAILEDKTHRLTEAIEYATAASNLVETQRAGSEMSAIAKSRLAVLLAKNNQHSVASEISQEILANYNIDALGRAGTIYARLALICCLKNDREQAKLYIEKATKAVRIEMFYDSWEMIETLRDLSEIDPDCRTLASYGYSKLSVKQSEFMAGDLSVSMKDQALRVQEFLESTMDDLQ